MIIRNLIKVVREYDFYYSNTNYVKRLILFSSLTFAVLLVLVLAVPIFRESVAAILAVFIVPVLLFAVNFKKIKSNGKAMVSDESIKIELAEKSLDIVLDNIESYRFTYYQGSALELEFKDKSKLKLSCGEAIDKGNHFNAFCQDVENILNNFLEKKPNRMMRKPSFVETQWFLGLIVFGTLVILFFIGFAIAIQKSLPIQFYALVGIIIYSWVAYFNAKNSKKLN